MSSTTAKANSVTTNPARSRDPADYRPAQMTCDLRRLRRKGFIGRQAGSTR